MNLLTNTMTLSIGKFSLCLLSLSIASTFAGSEAVIPMDPPASNNGDWCSWLQNKPGTLYKNDDNPYIQELGIFGRFHWQYAYVDGRGAQDAGTRKFNYDTEEIRRFRLGLKIKFLNYFELKGNADLENDLAPTGAESDHDIEYAGIYAATLGFDAGKAFGVTSLDSLKISVGKHKAVSNAEQSISSKKHAAIERAAISNYIQPGNSTGLVVSAKKGAWDFSAGIFSGDDEAEFSDSNGDNDYFYALHAGYKFTEPYLFDKSRINFNFIINNNDQANQPSSSSNSNPDGGGTFAHDWVASVSTHSQKGRFGLLTDFIYGDNGNSYNFAKGGVRNRTREGHFWGVVILPTYKLIEGKLEAVFRYQYAHASENQGFRIGSRYSRRAGGALGFTGANDLSDGRGDSHHSAYLGLNYRLCGDNARAMIGIEYDNLNSGSQDVYEGYTAWAALRMHF